MNTPDAFFQYRGLGGQSGAFLLLVRKVDVGAYQTTTEFFAGDSDKQVMRAAQAKRDELALEATVERVVIGLVTQELRRQPVERDGKVVLPFNKAKANGKLFL